MERQFSQKLAIPFYSVPAGKWRRYFDWHNFTDILKTCWGIVSAWRLLGKLKPDIIFSKGGFVSFPTVFAGWLRGIKVIAHESDIIPGLTTKLCLPFVTTQCLGFEASKKYFSKHKEKLVVTGIPLRTVILQGNKKRGLEFLKLQEHSKPILLILGGSLGAQKINQIITTNLFQLTKTYTIVHMTGVGKKTIDAQTNYIPYESFHEELADIYQCADIIISRAGATTLAELLTLKKKVILIPLGKDQSRGDQIVNANTHETVPTIRILFEEQLTIKNLLAKLEELKDVSDNFKTLAQFSHSQATEKVIETLSRTLNSKVRTQI